MTQEIYDFCIIKTDRIHHSYSWTHTHSANGTSEQRKKSNWMRPATSHDYEDDMIRKAAFWSHNRAWLLPFINNDWMGHKYEKSRLEMVLCLHFVLSAWEISHKCYQPFFVVWQIDVFVCVCTLLVVICLVVDAVAVCYIVCHFSLSTHKLPAKNTQKHRAQRE